MILETHSNIVWTEIFIVCFELAHLFLNIPRETEQCDRTEWTPGPRELNTLAAQVEQPEISR